MSRRSALINVRQERNALVRFVQLGKVALTLRLKLGLLLSLLTCTHFVDALLLAQKTLGERFAKGGLSQAERSKRLAGLKPKSSNLLTCLQAKGPDLLSGLLLTKHLVLRRLLGLKEVLRLRLCKGRGAITVDLGL